MLAAIAIASPPEAQMAFATCSQTSALRLEITTFAPACAMCSAIERPMPRVDPVTMATLPLRSKGFISGVRDEGRGAREEGRGEGFGRNGPGHSLVPRPSSLVPTVVLQ